MRGAVSDGLVQLCDECRGFDQLELERNLSYLNDVMKSFNLTYSKEQEEMVKKVQERIYRTSY